MLARTSSIALVAALAATLAAVLAADARAASPTLEPARFSLTIDGYEIASVAELDGTTSGTISLRRGEARGTELWAWYEAARNGVLAGRKDATIVLYDSGGRPVATWHLENAWPSKIEIGGLKSDANEVSIETLTIAHEGFGRD